MPYVESFLNNHYLPLTWASLVAQLVKNPPVILETWVWSLGWKDPWRREGLPTPVFWPGEFHGLCSPWGQRIRHNEQLSLSLFTTYFLPTWLSWAHRKASLSVILASVKWNLDQGFWDLTEINHMHNLVQYLRNRLLTFSPN